jgi:menaquinone-dependent protoporphyrinogen IX oxidase
MKILIAYATKSGTARRCAEMLADRLRAHRVSLVDLSEQTPDPREYDVTVVGASVRMAKLHKAAAQYLERYADVLREQRTGYFLCCGLTEFAEDYLTRFFPQDLRKTAFSTAYFGGELRLENHRGLEKLFVRMMRHSIVTPEDPDATPTEEEENQLLPAILPENIDRFADELRGLLLAESRRAADLAVD